jgi:autotransporter-associated beta strand protein
MTTTGDAVIGYTASSHANWISIGGAFGTTNALWDFTTKKLTIGRSAGATGNYATLHSGGVLTNVTTVLLAGTGSRLNFNGGTLAAGADGDLIALDSLGSPVNCTNFVQAGGAVIDTPNFRVVTNTLPMLEYPASAGGGLTKLGNGTLTLNEANTYSGQTTISGGRLALGSTGAINNSSKITIAAGGMFDVSAIPAYTLSSDLSASGTGTVHGTNAAVIVGDSAGSVSFGSRAILLTFTPASLTGDDTSPALVVSQAPLELGGSTLTVTSSSTLGVGDYRLMNATAISGSFSSIDISGVPLAAGTTGTVVAASGGTVTLSVTATVPPSFPPGGVGILPDGNISLTATGAVGAAYSLWASTNVALTPVNSTWTLLDSGTITVSPFTVNDLTATNYPQRFYLFSAP